MSKNFKKISLFDVIHEFKVAIKKSAEIQIKAWKRQKKENFVAFKLSSFDSKQNILIVRPAANAKMAKKIKGEVLIEILIEKNIYFTTGDLELVKNLDIYLIQLDNQIFQPIHRKDFRVYASEKLNISLDIDSNNYEALDLSVSGICIKVSKDKRNLFTENEFLNTGALKINSNKIEIPALEIKRITAMVGQEGEEYDIGIKFHNLSTTNESKLIKIVNREMRVAIFEHELAQEKKASLLKKLKAKF